MYTSRHTTNFQLINSQLLNSRLLALAVYVEQAVGTEKQRKNFGNIRGNYGYEEKIEKRHS